MLLKRLLFFLTLLFVGALLYLFHPTPLVIDYGTFADTRPFFSIPHFLNVVSNLFFLVVSLVGFFFVRKDKRSFPTRLEKGLASLFLTALFLTGIGSTYFHFDPKPFTLLFDRLPIALTIASFYGLLIVRRIHFKTGALLSPLLITCALFSVIFWYFTNDLRPYILTQALPLLSAPVMCLLFPSPKSKDGALFLAVALYVLALLFDLTDIAVFHFTKKTISGHTLKHLFAAAASFFLLIYLVDLKKNTRRSRWFSYFENS